MTSKGILWFHIAGLEPTSDHSLINNMEFEGDVVAWERGGKSLDELPSVLQGSRVDLGLHW